MIHRSIVVALSVLGGTRRIPAAVVFTGYEKISFCIDRDLYNSLFALREDDIWEVVLNKADVKLHYKTSA